jgi:Mg-chelatase subunit ChlD
VVLGRGWLAIACLWAAAGGAAAAGAPVRILIDSPSPGATVSDQVHQARVQGSALAEGDRPLDYDVILVIDVSQSTKAASGADVDGDGVVGVNPRNELLPPGTFPPDMLSTDPEDTVLHAEIAAARALLETLDPRRVQVALASFGGEVDPVTGERASLDQQDAWLEVPLSADFDQVRAALGAILARGPSGATNFAAGVRLGVRELAGLSGAKSRPRPQAKKVMLFLTDGVPTFPIGKAVESDPGDKEAAVQAAQLAHEAGIVINTYALGGEALSYPVAVTELARVTLGSYTPIQNPGDIMTILQGVSFANVEDVVLTNLSTGDFSTDVRLSPDGSFFGYVPVREGANRVRVSALASDGTRGSYEVEFTFEMAGLSPREQARELERLRELNKNLILLREKERIRAFRDQQRKEVEIEATKEE